jgi:hypothetical protein
MKKYTLEIVRDENAESPREWDNIGIMVCVHNRYNLGDKDTAHHFQNEVKVKIRYEGETWEEIAKYAKKEMGALVVLPLYLYDHSGVTMRTTPFSCGWDSGQVGIVYATKERCEKMGNDPKDLENLKRLLIGEVGIYDKYLTGEVYGYIIKEVSTCNLGHSHNEVIDSCWGFYGEEEAREAGQQAMPKE